MATNLVAEVGAKVGAVLLKSAVGLVLVFVLGGLIIGILIYVKYRKQFDITIKIKSTRSEDKHSIIFDKAAIINDKKDGTKYFKMKGMRIELPVPPFNVLQRTNKGDYVEIWRKSEDEFVYLTPSKISRKYYIKSDGKAYPMADLIQKQVEPDVAFWNVKRKKMNKGLFDTEHWMMKLLPFIPQIIGGVVTLFVLYVLFNSLPAVLSALTDLTRELASLKGAEIAAG